MRLWSIQWDGTSAGSFESLLGHWHSCARGGLLKQCLEVPVSVWLGEACARLLRNFWLHVCEAETAHRRECVSRNRARERHKVHNSNWCAYVCVFAWKEETENKLKATGIASEFRVMFNEVKKQFRSTEGLSKHIFYVCPRLKCSSIIMDCLEIFCCLAMTFSLSQYPHTWVWRLNIVLMSCL